MATPTSQELRRASATLETHNQTPRKVRLVADLVRGKVVSEALAALTFLPKRAALPVAKLIRSAVANAAQRGEDEGVLVVRAITVESAGMSKRYMPRAFGRAAPIRRRRSRVIVTLATSPAGSASPGSRPTI
ncbi:MAG: 50S ribosomal protein L22 [bacterium]|nr:50S ribosomal protein L22 [bacterium]